LIVWLDRKIGGLCTIQDYIAYETGKAAEYSAAFPVSLLEG
jgi:hypothetical protein